MKTILALFLCAFSFVGASEKLYFDIDEMPTGEDAFHIHTGHNVWIKTSSIHRDVTGFYTYTHNITMTQNGVECEFAREWKCPYCHNYWPWGSPCRNPDCPGKFKA